MEDNFTRARLEGIRKNKYMLKHLKNKIAKDFLTVYGEANKGEINKLKELTYMYNLLCEGNLNICPSTFDLEKISQSEIQDVYLGIRNIANNNFIYFYESYLRKIEREYEQKYVENALGDLKNAYYIYRKANNSAWNLDENQITKDEMTNLYNILTEKTKNEKVSSKEIEEK